MTEDRIKLLLSELNTVAILEKYYYLLVRKCYDDRKREFLSTTLNIFSTELAAFRHCFEVLEITLSEFEKEVTYQDLTFTARQYKLEK